LAEQKHASIALEQNECVSVMPNSNNTMIEKDNINSDFSEGNSFASPLSKEQVQQIENLKNQKEKIEKELKIVLEGKRSLEGQVVVLTEKVNLKVKQLENTIPKSYIKKYRVQQQKLQEEVKLL